MAVTKPDGCQSYIFLHGVIVPRPVRLTEAIDLLPASGLTAPELALSISTCSEDAAVYLLLLPRISSELRVIAPDSKSLAAAVWNAGWDALLLGAACACQVGQSIESRSSAADVTPSSSLRVTNYHLHGWRHEPKALSEFECKWLEGHFSTASRLLSESEIFRSAVHCLSSYWWHPHPRPQLALLWAGIESLFKIDSELSFRLSLFTAKFLEPYDKESSKQLFLKVKRLYSARSKAVHGGHMKGDITVLVSESASLLHRLVRRCIEVASLPITEELAL